MAYSPAMAKAQDIGALVVAAGQGARVGGPVPKQFRPIGGQPMLVHSLATFVRHDRIASALAVIGVGHEAAYAQAAPKNDRLREPVKGGINRQQSVLFGLRALARDDPPAYVLIHDAARPFVSTDLIDRVAEALGDAAAVIPALPISSTIKRVSGGRVVATEPRDGLEAAETPQGFAFNMILEAHEKAARAGVSLTDDAAVAEWVGIPVKVVAGDPSNVKITTEADMIAAERRFVAESSKTFGDIRVGLGFDVHALGPGDHLVLGGVTIPHTRGLVGHSDADVVLHAVTDAILGALGEGDIGEHFPPGDPRWKGANSGIFLADAVGRVARRGGTITHIDVAILAQNPRLAPHREAMRASIAKVCGIGTQRVGVKATTNEGLGFIGRGEGISAQAVATIRLPFTR
jgi:2-C-methyl-D-erythritol 4-phosphate cytidylyltransferase/2-C-methyl-D-erythritol 2,4-cyclodiphosphate synthase